jgi:hypothetical protein
MIDALEAGGLSGRRVVAADHRDCPGCGRWAAHGAARCSAGHPQHECGDAVARCAVLTGNKGRRARVRKLRKSD